MSDENVVFLRGKQVSLRPMLESDEKLQLQWINNPDNKYFLSNPLPMMEEDQKEWRQRVREKKNRQTDIVLMIVAKGKPIGTMGLHNINWKDRTAVTGALIGEKDCWGKGYGTEAKMLLLNYAFNTLNLRKISSHVFAFNGRSQAYSKKCGYQEEGRLKKHHFHLGQYWDEVILAVFREDWFPLWDTYVKEHNIPLVSPDPE